MLIKLADRLHNMRTLGAMPEHKRKRIAKETLDIFAPLANRLGIWQIKWELEDLGFRYLNPEKYKEIADQLEDRQPDREAQIEAIKQNLVQLLASNDIKAEISWAAQTHLFHLQEDDPKGQTVRPGKGCPGRAPDRSRIFPPAMLRWV